jgi:hypothetical protein
MRDLRSPSRIYEELPSFVFDYTYAQSLTENDFRFLQKRLGPLHAKLRLGIEADHEAQVFGQGHKLFSYREFNVLTFSHSNVLEICGTLLAGT